MSQSVQRYRVTLGDGAYFDGDVSGALIKLELPVDALILGLRCAQHALSLLVQCDVAQPLRQIGLYVIGSAQAIPDGMGPYLGSFQDGDAGELHVFLVSAHHQLMEH